MADNTTKKTNKISVIVSEETETSPVVPEKKVRRKPISKKLREQLWVRDCGNVFTSQCYVCTGRMTAVSFEAGHVISVADGGTNDIDNLKAICMTCNRSMGKENMLEYKARRFPAHRKGWRRLLYFFYTKFCCAKL